MKTQYMDLQAFLRDKIKTVEDYKKATSLAVGVAVGRMIAIPSSGADTAAEAFDADMKLTAAQLVYSFNEEIVIDCDLARETARGIWMVRYMAAHPALNVPLVPMGDCGFMNKITRSFMYINPQDLCYLDKYSELMIVLVNRITSVMTAE